MKLYNTLTRKTEELVTLEPKKVKIYTCGLTVYSQPHIGNWVGYIYWDVLVRTLRANGYEVERTQNYTDVGHLVSDDDNGEDKMEKGARLEGITAWDVAEKYIAVAEHEGYEILGLIRPQHVIRATDYIDQQIQFVVDLEKKGYTYTIPGEGVYFDTAKLSDYGKLAKLDIKGLQAGARVEVEGKKNVTDFALWKFSPIGQKRDMEWRSPWGIGFPGWHLECSVIARETLGDQIDIHCGGVDHIPVHHTNEIAQTEAVTGKLFSKYWMHNNHLKVDGGKMSKSLGNVYTLQDILDRGFDLDAFKLMILSKHYTTEGNFTWENLQASQNKLNELHAWADLRYQPNTDIMPEELDNLFRSTKQEVLSATSNDLDTPTALIKLYELVNYMSKISIPGVEGNHTDGSLKFFDNLLGLNLSTRKDITDEQKKIISDRETARAEKNWAKSDELRDILAKQKIGLKDGKFGQIWYRI